MKDNYGLSCRVLRSSVGLTPGQAHAVFPQAWTRSRDKFHAQFFLRVSILRSMVIAHLHLQYLAIESTIARG
jgi:hypothetical protein